ncbi:hypothetical protein ACHAXT_004107 [Thalassiosira profunda]
MSPNSSHHRLSIGSYGTDSSEHDALDEECDAGSDDDDWGERSPALFPPLELFKRRIVYQPALVLIAIVLLGFGWMKRDASAIHPDVAGRYEPTLIWSDEFDGDAVDLSKWTFVNGNGCDVGLCGWGNNELEWYTPSNARVSGGKLVLEARKYETPGSPPTYTSSKIISRGKADFGVVPSAVEGEVASLKTSRRFEARMKLPWGKGIWPAFWMLPTYDTYGGWPKHRKGRKYSARNGNYGLDGQQHQYSEAGITLAEAPGPVNETFHTYSVERLPGTIRWYIDDILYATVSKEEMAPYHWSFDEKFYFILNLAVGGNWPGNPVDDNSSDGQEVTLFPQSFEVDHVRVYEGIFARISGQSVVECSEENVRYDIVNVDAEEGDSYTWTVPESATIVTGQGTSRIAVNFHSNGARSEAIRVRANGNDRRKASIHDQKLQTDGIGIRVKVTDFRGKCSSADGESKPKQFAFDCGRPSTCTQFVLHRTTDEFSCGERIEYLMHQEGMSEKDACREVQHRVSVPSPSLHLLPESNPFLLTDGLSAATYMGGGDALSGPLSTLRTFFVVLTAAIFGITAIAYLTASFLVPKAAEQLERDTKRLRPGLWEEYEGKLEEGQEMVNRPDLLQELGNIMQPLIVEDYEKGAVTSSSESTAEVEAVASNEPLEKNDKQDVIDVTIKAPE